MTPQADPFVGHVNWLRVIAAGLTAGLFINIFEYVGHRVLLNDAWTAAFRALGKTPTGWRAFIPANFFVGLLMVWFFRTTPIALRRRSNERLEVRVSNMGSVLANSYDVDYPNGSFSQQIAGLCHGLRLCGGEYSGVAWRVALQESVSHEFLHIYCKHAVRTIAVYRNRNR
jgi:hypothetical protein